MDANENAKRTNNAHALWMDEEGGEQLAVTCQSHTCLHLLIEETYFILDTRIINIAICTRDAWL